MQDERLLPPWGHLIHRSLEGDREAFGQIVRQYQGLVSGVTFGLTGDYHQSEDLAQETFIVAWKSLGELRDPQKLPHWLCGIARNLTRNLAKNDRSRHATARTLSRNLSQDTENIENLAATADTPLDHAIRAERNRLVVEALQKIPEKYRLPLVLNIRSGMTTAEIARLLEISESTFYQRLSRAKKFLRIELEHQVEHAIRATGPGEFFSLSVLAALPVLASNAGCKAMLVSASAASVSATTASNEVVSTGVGTTFSFVVPFGTAFAVVFRIALGLSVWLLLAVGALPGIWYSVRNAPTLRARRYLVRSSLRAHCLFFVVATPVFWVVSVAPASINVTNMPRFLFVLLAFGHATVASIALAVLIAVCAVCMLCFSPFTYRRLIREDTGLQAPKTAILLEDGFLSYKRLCRSVMVMGMFMVVLYGMVVTVAASRLLNDYNQWNLAFAENSFTTAWESFFGYGGTLYALVGLVFLSAFFGLHRGFLKMVKDEEASEASPPIVDAKTPFRTRWFLEWTVGFGVFLAACLVVGLYPWNISFRVLIPHSPYLLLGYVLFLTILSSGIAAFNVRFPYFRWLANSMAIVAFFFASSFYNRFAVTLEWSRSGRYPFTTFFDTAASWPVILGGMILAFFLLYALVATLVLGGLFLHQNIRRSVGFFKIKTLCAIYGAGMIVTLLCAALFHSHLKAEYFVCHILARKGADASVELAERLLGLADAMVKSTPQDRHMNAFALSQRAEMLLRTGRYDEAIADFDEIIRRDNHGVDEATKRHFTAYYHYQRGLARLMKQDYEAALVDFEQARNVLLADYRVIYHSGLANERLGRTAQAVADYTKVIDSLNGYAKPPALISVAPRQRGDTIKSVDLNGLVGYEIPLPQLERIRDDLQIKR